MLVFSSPPPLVARLVLSQRSGPQSNYSKEEYMKKGKSPPDFFSRSRNELKVAKLEIDSLYVS